MQVIKSIIEYALRRVIKDEYKAIDVFGAYVWACFVFVGILILTVDESIGRKRDKNVG